MVTLACRVHSLNLQRNAGSQLLGLSSVSLRIDSLPVELFGMRRLHAHLFPPARGHRKGAAGFLRGPPNVLLETRLDLGDLAG